MDISNFHNLHAGETVLLVGNGKNLSETPPEWFGFPSIGMNTIYKYAGWKPTYYTAVDSRVWREFGQEIAEKYADIPKFVPRPNLDKWQGENFYRFYHRPGALFPMNGKPMLYDNLMSEEGISYGNVMHVAMQLAAWMGFSTLLLIGVEHKPFHAQDHFWGCDHGMNVPPVEQWFDGYREITAHLRHNGIRVLNISPNTHVDSKILPRGDWREWRNNEHKNDSTLSGRTTASIS
jgi:hypothetical protein